MRSQGAIPVWAITSLDHTQILFSNVHSEPSQWVISSATVYQQRFFASSTATISLSCNLTSVHDMPPELPLYKKKIDNEEVLSRLGPEDEICVWMGYLPTMRPVAPEDLENSLLLRNYIGVIDTIAAIGTPKGISLTIQCRDRVRYLSDSEVTFDPSYGNDKNASTLAKAFAKGNENVLRSDLILKISQLGIGHVAIQGETDDCNLNGRVIKKGFIQDLGFYVQYNSSSGNALRGGGGAATVGTGALLGITGQTGVGTGPHLHLQYARSYDPSRNRVTDEHANRIALNGVPLGSVQITSEHWTRNPGRTARYGRKHYGIDYAASIGTEIRSTVPIEKISGVISDRGGGGLYTAVTFPDGVSLQMLHQDPAVYNVELGSGGEALQAAPTPTPQPSQPTTASGTSDPNLRAVLDMIAWAEGTSTIAGSDRGYNVQYTGRLFNNGYRDHPRQILGTGLRSSASGRYQFLIRTWDGLVRKLGLTSFSPENQDKAAIDLLKQRGAYDAVLKQDWPTVLDKIACEWASIPRSNGSFCYPSQGTKTPQQIYDFLGSHLGGADPTFTGSPSESSSGPGGYSFVRPLTEAKRPDFFYTCKNEFSKDIIPCRARTSNPKELLDLDSEMRFNIFTGRLPYSVDIISKDFSIETQIPIEFIRVLSAQEPYPTETFMNHLDGQFYYTPRVNDVSGLADPKRFYRTYYHRTIPPQVSGSIPKPSFESIIERLETEGCEFTQTFDYSRIFGQVDYNQMTINFKEELSSLGMKTNFFIANQSPNGSVAGDAIIMHMSARPAFLRGHEIGGRNMYIVDETIKNIGEAAAVAASVARLYAKELRTASMTVLGDASLTPGELVQTINSPIYSQTLQTYIDERQSIVEYEGATRASYLSALEVTRQGIESRAETSAPLTGNYSSEPSPDGYERVDEDYKIRARKAEFKKSAEDIFCSATKKETATVVEKDTEGDNAAATTEEWGENHWRKSGFTQDPRSIWRIEGVRHTLNSAGSQGWTSELVLLSPY